MGKGRRDWLLFHRSRGRILEPLFEPQSHTFPKRSFDFIKPSSTLTISFHQRNEIGDEVGWGDVGGCVEVLFDLLR